MSEFTDNLNIGPRTKEEAHKQGLTGWNLRCNQCGDYGASWVPDTRPTWGALALCPLHQGELEGERERHRNTMNTLTQVYFEQVGA